MLQTKADKKNFWLLACSGQVGGVSASFGEFFPIKNKKYFLLQYAFLCFNVLFSDLSDKDILMC